MIKDFKETLVGVCTACGTEIMDLTIKKKKQRRLENYREHIVELSNNTLMRVAICEKCKVKLVSGKDVQATADLILENHKFYWDLKKQKWHKELKIEDPNTSKEKYLSKKLILNNK